MSYYSCIDFDEVNIPKNKVKEFNEKAKELEDSYHYKDEWFFQYKGLRADEDGNLEYTNNKEYWRTHYESEKLACLIQKYGGRGTLSFFGEDGREWAFILSDDCVIKTEHKWFKIDAWHQEEIEVTTEIINTKTGKKEVIDNGN